MEKAKDRKGKAAIAFAAYQDWKREQVRCGQKIKYLVFRKYIRPFLRLLLFGQRKICGFKIEVLNRVRITEKAPVIFAVTHIGKWDFEMVNEQLTIFFYVIALDFVNTYMQVSGWFFRANGVVWVNEISREDNSEYKRINETNIETGWQSHDFSGRDMELIGK